VKRAHAQLWRVSLRLRRPLRTAHGPVAARDGFVVEVADAFGRRGFGEALPLPSFGGESPAQCEAALRAALPALAAAAAGDCGLDALAVAPGPVAQPVAANALACACADLAARRAGVPLAHWLGARAPDVPAARAAPAGRVALAALLAADGPAEVAQRAREAVAAGFGTLKLKLSGDVGDDLARVQALRDAVGARVALRLDANACWDEAAAGPALRALAAFAPEWVEQPVAPDDDAALARLRGRHGVAIAADESLRDAACVQRLLRAGAADVLVLKLAMLGGPLAVLEAAHAARRVGVRVCITSFLGSTLGIAAAAHTAAALPGAQPPAAGLATAALLADDLAPPLAAGDGELRLPEAAGIGREAAAATLARAGGRLAVAEA